MSGVRVDPLVLWGTAIAALMEGDLLDRKSARSAARSRRDPDPENAAIRMY